MTLIEIKKAISEGVKVHWSNDGYEVIVTNNDYLIKHWQGSCIGLTWSDGVTLNGQEEQFYIAGSR